MANRKCERGGCIKTKLERLKNEALSELEGLGVVPPQNIRFELSTRFTRSLGQCVKKGLNYVITINEDFLAVSDKTIKQTLIHELLHTLPGCFNHGPKWKALAFKVNKSLNYDIRTQTLMTNEIQTVLDKNASNKYKYKVECVSCGYAAYRTRKSGLIKNVSNYRCGLCSDRLRVINLQ